MTKRELQFTLKDDFRSAIKPFLLYLATTIIWLSIFKDYVRVGLRPEWIAIRIFYLPFILVVFQLTKTKFINRKFYEFPIWAAGLYITGFCTYFSFSLGFIASDMAFGLLQYYLGIAVMPIRRRTFYLTVGTSIGIYVLGNITHAGMLAVPHGPAVSNLIPLLIFSIIVFEITHRIRIDKLRSQNELTRLAAGVAHDVRSPLAALKSIISSGAANELPEAQRTILRSSLSRIEDIANNLISDFKNKALVEYSNLTTEMIAPILTSVISEKRAEFNKLSALEILFDPTPLNAGAFAKINQTEFKRLISNLINNAKEAMNGKGKISVGLRVEGSLLKFSVEDTGPGIERRVLENLRAGVMQSSKSTGLGIGLRHASSTAKQFAGTISIDSVPGAGTVVAVSIPTQNSPKWFAKEINTQGIKRIVVVDDDSSIHDLWESRFAATRIPVDHIWKISEALKQIDRLDHKATLFLVDYEFIGEEENGIRVLEKIFAGTGILVTSRFEELEIRDHAKRLGIKIIPKSFASCIQINLKNDQLPHGLVLIDDDELVRATWRNLGKKENILVHVFESTKAFRDNEFPIPKNMPLYIDSNLGEAVKGEDFARILDSEGFANIYITTGYDAERFKSFTFLKGVIGKEPPWVD